MAEMDKEHILNEIRRTAKENGGSPLGQARFQQQTESKTLTGSAVTGPGGVMRYGKPGSHQTAFRGRTPRICSLNAS